MDKKIAVVSGATKGIGLKIAQTLSDEGYFVIGTYVSNYDQETIQALEQDSFILRQVDASNFEAVQAFAKEVKAQFGNITHLINNAGIVKDNLIMMMKEDEFDAVIDVNLKGPFNLIKAFSRQLMKSSNASIVNVSSVIGLVGNSGQSNYAASKAGLVGMSKSLAKEFASRQVRVNCVAPGFIQTEMTNVLNEEIKNAILNQIALKKFGEAQDVADAVSFLISDKAKYITGQTINVCGGMVL